MNVHKFAGIFTADRMYFGDQQKTKLYLGRESRLILNRVYKMLLWKTAAPRRCARR
jgi:hypothetical protein